MFELDLMSHARRKIWEVAQIEQTGLDKFAVAAALQEIGALLELQDGVNRFKARAYERGARAIAGLTTDLGQLVEQDRLTSIPGVGDALASQIKQLYLTGTSTVLNKLRQEFPPGIIELSGLPGLSISKIKALHEALGIKSLGELKAAAEAGRVRTVKGFGAKTEENLLAAIAGHQESDKSKKRIHIHEARLIGEQVLNYLKASGEIGEISFAGSLRRWKETVGTIRVVASHGKPSSLIEHFLRFPMIVQVTYQSNDHCAVVLSDGAQISLLAVSASKYPLALMFETGSPSHLAKLQSIAAQKHLELSDWSLATPTEVRRGRKAKLQTEPRGEEEIYERLRMQNIPPEVREDTGEIEAALAKRLPQDLVSVDDIKGMVHCHTTYSDGKHTIEEMAHAAEAMGMRYLTITDHSPTAFYAGGLTVDRLRRQWDEIDEVQERVKVKILKGTESDIVADGGLDYPDSILEQFDVIVASIHSRYKMDSQKMTRRLITAMRQPVFKIWGHALGRLIDRRPPFECDVERVLDAISESQAAIEINGDPYRLDMEPRWIREARKRKIPFVISVDAHSTGAMKNLQYGVGIARRGWVRKGEVLNALGVKGFAQTVRPVS